MINTLKKTAILILGVLLAAILSVDTTQAGIMGELIHIGALLFFILIIIALNQYTTLFSVFNGEKGSKNSRSGK